MKRKSSLSKSFSKSRTLKSAEKKPAHDIEPIVKNALTIKDTVKEKKGAAR